MEAVLGRPLTPPIDLTGKHWAVVPRGVMEMSDNLRGVQLGQASGRVIPDPDSEMARVFCSDSEDGGLAFSTAETTASRDFIRESFFTLEVRDPAELFGRELSDTGNAECPPVPGE
jgi:hypothetical protein